MGLKPRDCADCVYRPALPLSRPGTPPVEYTFGLWVGDGRARLFLHQSLNCAARVRPKLKVWGEKKNPKWNSWAIFQFLKQSQWRSRYKSRSKRVDLQLTLTLAGLGEWVKVWNKNAERQMELFLLWVLKHVPSRSHRNLCITASINIFVLPTEY